MVTHGLGRYERAIEDAVYFACREALQNAIKHAPAATVIMLTITDRGDRLEFGVADDGPGFAAALPGIGFASMHQRIEALGGRLTSNRCLAPGPRYAEACLWGNDYRCARDRP